LKITLPFSYCGDKKKAGNGRDKFPPNEEQVNDQLGTSKHGKVDPFMIADFEVIGDLSAFSLARAKRLVDTDGEQKVTRYGSTFQFITVSYLTAYIENLESVKPKVFLTVGLCDQMIQAVTVEQFENFYIRLLKGLFDKGMRILLTLIPPPSRRLTTLRDYRYYVGIRDTIMNIRPPNNILARLMNIDEFVFQYIDAGGGILAHKSDLKGKTLAAQRVNIDLIDAGYVILSKTRRFYLHGNVAKAIEELIQNFSHSIEATEADKSQSPEISAIQSPMIRRGQFLHLKMTIGPNETLALIDTGASMSVISQEFVTRLKASAPNYIQGFRLEYTVTIRMADKSEMAIEELVRIRFWGADAVWLHVYLLVAPRLSRDVILGMNFFKAYNMAIYCGEQRLGLTLPSGENLSLPADQFLDKAETLQFLEPLDIAAIVGINGMQEEFELLEIGNEIVDRVEPIRRELVARIDRAVTNQIITPEDGNRALQTIIPLAEVYSPP